MKPLVILRGGCYSIFDRQIWNFCFTCYIPTKRLLDNRLKGIRLWQGEVFEIFKGIWIYTWGCVLGHFNDKYNTRVQKQ